MAVHDGLGQAGGAAGVHHPQRMVEGQPFRGEGGVCRPQRVQVVRLALRRRQVGLQVAVAGDQHLRLDLAEAVEHRHRPHVGRAHRPDRTQAGAGQEDDDRLRHVGHHRAQPVAALQAHAAQRRRAGRHLAAQLGPGHFAQRALGQHRLVGEDDRRVPGRMAGVGMREQVLRVVELCAREPVRAGHARVLQHRAKGRRRLHGEIVPHRSPEGRQVGHRPAPQRVVVGELQAARLPQPALVACDLGLGHGHRRASSTGPGDHARGVRAGLRA